MIETVRRGLVERGLERGCRFMMAANFLDDMRVHLLFNRFEGDAQRVLDRERRARTVRDDANTVHPQERHPAVFLVVRLFLDGAKGVARQISAGHARFAFHQLVLEPAEDRVGDRFTSFQNHVADKAVADHDLDWVRKQIVALNVAAKVERALLQHFENFFRQVAPFDVFAADRHEADRRFLITEHVAGINRAHDRILQKMLGFRVAVCAGIDEDKHIRLRWNDGGNAWPVDARQSAELDRGRRDGGAGVSRAYDRARLTFFYQIDGAADG